MQFADIKNDIAFRKIFGNEQKTAPLISFLNASLALEGDYQVDKWTYFIKHSEELHVIPDFANEDEGLKTAFIEADKYQWSKEELKAYDNVTIKEQDERGEKEIIAQRAMEKGREESKLEMILEMDKEGFSIRQIANVSKKSEQEVAQILDNHTN